MTGEELEQVPIAEQPTFDWTRQRRRSLSTAARRWSAVPASARMLREQSAFVRHCPAFNFQMAAGNFSGRRYCLLSAANWRRGELGLVLRATRRAVKIETGAGRA